MMVDELVQEFIEWEEVKIALPIKIALKSSTMLRKALDCFVALSYRSVLRKTVIGATWIASRECEAMFAPKDGRLPYCPSTAQNSEAQNLSARSIR
jgi:hypothetical protein